MQLRLEGVLERIREPPENLSYLISIRLLIPEMIKCVPFNLLLKIVVAGMLIFGLLVILEAY
jgi:hypothetical protein